MSDPSLQATGNSVLHLPSCKAEFAGNNYSASLSFPTFQNFMAGAAAASSAATPFTCRAAALLPPLARNDRALWSRGGPAECSFRQGGSICAGKCLFLATSQSGSSPGRSPLWSSSFSSHRRLCVRCLDKPSGNILEHVSDHPQPSHTDLPLRSSDGAAEVTSLKYRSEVSKVQARKFQNRFLMFTRLGSVINDAAESFFKSEIRKRLFVTAVLILVSRVGYFIPLPGFDRRLIPEDYLTFASGSMDGDWKYGINQETAGIAIDKRMGTKVTFVDSESSRLFHSLIGTLFSTDQKELLEELLLPVQFLGVHGVGSCGPERESKEEEEEEEKIEIAGEREDKERVANKTYNHKIIGSTLMGLVMNRHLFRWFDGQN
ncbi:hypothetical protein Taro_001261 [Colocasia esculenta]|uniref:Uncharacterized protein n=1 Tax=Colocasia esculenta TaxID=4460 RepID=A0A843THM6_COLES|nr:hypothetical protein [Colocasia esculenta]